MLAIFFISNDCVTVLIVRNRSIKSGDKKYENINFDKYQAQNPALIHINGIKISLFRLLLSCMEKTRPYSARRQGRRGPHHPLKAMVMHWFLIVSSLSPFIQFSLYCLFLMKKRRYRPENQRQKDPFHVI